MIRGHVKSRLVMNACRFVERFRRINSVTHTSAANFRKDFTNTKGTEKGKTSVLQSSLSRHQHVPNQTNVVTCSIHTIIARNRRWLSFVRDWPDHMEPSECTVIWNQNDWGRRQYQFQSLYTSWRKNSVCCVLIILSYCVIFIWDRYKGLSH